MTGNLLRKLIYSQRHIAIFATSTSRAAPLDLRDLKTFLHLAESRHFGRSARAMHVSPSTLSRQIQRLEEDLGQPLFVRDNRTVTLTEAGEELRVFAQQTLLQYQQLRHTIDQQGPSLSGELHIFCSVTAAYSHLPPILDRFRAEHPSVEIKLTTGDAADAMEKVVTGEADLAIAGKPETLPGAVAFSMLENLAVVLIAPALPCPVRNQVSAEKPDWSTVPFIMADQGPVRRRIELWFRRNKISNPMIYATVGGHEAMVSMVALGCKYLRICHLNNCATGVATQDDKLRKNHYHGLPFKVTNYFEFIARETRELMAQLGVTRLVDLIGRTDLLKELDGFTAKQQKLALSKLLETAEPHPGKALYCTENNPPFDNGLLNAQLLQQAKPFVDERQSKTFWFDIRNTDRSVGASLSGYIAQTHGDQGLAADPIKAYFNGTAGQSFGVWNAGGVELYLTGDANDYVGKGMAGGLIAIRPPVGSAFRSHEASIIGNTCLYGATGGRLYAAGRAGERFGVRNSGAITVVEGIGDNGCEYMTGGIVCILGKTGVNFGAGMTGGFAYVLDESGDFRKRVNPELVEVLSVDDLAIHEEHLRGLITEHVQHTGSQRGEEILANWSTFATKFALVKPKSSDVKALLGHRSRSAAELRVQAQ
ncbi:HTH-type transcriptional activator IlvY [Escherichia coli]|nr:HTH-type transcriptional activator IlvY [Escherichia coli]